VTRSVRAASRRRSRREGRVAGGEASLQRHELAARVALERDEEETGVELAAARVHPSAKE
jgi:hypothetical protein